MNIDRAVMAFAGCMVLISLALAHFASPLWLWLTAFVGFNLLQSSVTGFCPAAIVLRKAGHSRVETRSSETRMAARVARAVACRLRRRRRAEPRRWRAWTRSASWPRTAGPAAAGTGGGGGATRRSRGADRRPRHRRGGGRQRPGQARRGAAADHRGGAGRQRERGARAVARGRGIRGGSGTDVSPLRRAGGRAVRVEARNSTRPGPHAMPPSPRDAARAGVAQAAQQADYTLVRAPFDGMVSRRDVEAGETVAPGRALMGVYAPGALRIEVAVPQTAADAIRPIRGREVHSPDGRGVERRPVVVFPVADAASHSVNVRVSLPTLDPPLAPGTTARWCSPPMRRKAMRRRCAFPRRRWRSAANSAAVREAGRTAAAAPVAAGLAHRRPGGSDQRPATGRCGGARSGRGAAGAGSAARAGGRRRSWLSPDPRGSAFPAAGGSVPGQSADADPGGHGPVAGPARGGDHPREEEPQIDVTMANVIVPFDGASARDVEQLVSHPAGAEAVGNRRRQARLFDQPPRHGRADGGVPGRRARQPAWCACTTRCSPTRTGCRAAWAWARPWSSPRASTTCR